MVTALSDYAGGSEHEGVRTLGNLSLNLNSYRVAVGQDVIGLTYHELELLRVFFDQYDRVIPYKEITERIWGTSERTALRHLNVLGAPPAHENRVVLPVCYRDGTWPRLRAAQGARSRVSRRLARGLRARDLARRFVD